MTRSPSRSGEGVGAQPFERRYFRSSSAVGSWSHTETPRIAPSQVES
jgi:hypothetical protein